MDGDMLVMLKPRTIWLLVGLAVAIGWALYARAVRVDRLHRQVLGSRATLEAQLVHRARGRHAHVPVAQAAGPVLHAGHHAGRHHLHRPRHRRGRNPRPRPGAARDADGRGPCRWRAEGCG